MKLFPNKMLPPARGAAGMTLMEMMISVGIATTFVAGVIILTNITLKQGVFAIGNYNDLNAKSRQCLDYLSRDVRGAAQITSYGTNFFSATNKNGTAFSYAWDGSNKVTRTYAGVSSSILTNCDYISFAVYQRNPTNNFSFYATTNLALAKLLDVSWRCSRTYLGAKLNTESVQTARIVVRN